MAMLSVNGMAVPPPSEMKVSIFELNSASSRNAAGYTVMDCMGAKRRLTLRWAHLASDALAALLEQVGKGGFFEAVYPDPANGEMRRMKCYCGERVAGILRMEAGVPVWTNIEMTWMER